MGYRPISDAEYEAWAGPDEMECHVRSFGPGGKISCKISHDDVVLTTEDWVYPDRTCGQFDTGWLAFREGDEEVDYFISITGEVFIGRESVGTVVMPS